LLTKTALAFRWQRRIGMHSSVEGKGTQKARSSSDEGKNEGQVKPVETAITKELFAAAKLLMSGPVVAFTGAGVSAESGVPTYRDPGGLWRRYDMKKVSHIKNFLLDPIACWRFEMELHRLLQDVKPNDGHRALAELESLGVLVGIVTQNVEGLHTSAGSKVVVELHGNETQALCLRCGSKCTAVEAFKSVGWLDSEGNIVEVALPDVSPILRESGGEGSTSSSSSTPVLKPKPKREAHNSLRQSSSAVRSSSQSSSRSSSSTSSSSSSLDPLQRGESAPKAPPGAPCCPECGVGLLKPDAIYFGEKLHSPTLQRAEQLFSQSRVALIVGSSCQVAPASVLPLALRRRGGKIVDVNPKGSRFSDIADVWLKGPSAEVLPELVRTVELARQANQKLAD